jgi:GH24 family phage-related lysozyme (muramidase)
MLVTYKGQLVDFTEAFEDYAKVREGYRTVVYPDIKGIATVGIGHRVTDGMQVGEHISDDQVMQLFRQDYDSLNVEYYVAENPSYSLNQKLCIAHFIWMHGAGEYESSNYRRYFLEVSADAPYGTSMPDEASMQSYLASNWDIASPKIQAVNAKDCHVAYTEEDWSPNF